MTFDFEHLDLTGWRHAFDDDIAAALVVYHEAEAFEGDEPFLRPAHEPDECRVSPDGSRVLICGADRPLALVVRDDDGQWTLELDPWAWPLAR